MKTKTITIGTFDDRDTDYLVNLIMDYLSDMGIEAQSFAFSVEVEYYIEEEGE